MPDPDLAMERLIAGMGRITGEIIQRAREEDRREREEDRRHLREAAELLRKVAVAAAATSPRH